MGWRSRIPGGLKRAVVPAWNALHRLAWAGREVAGAVAEGRFERCAVCGRFGPTPYRRRVIPPRLVELWGLTPRQAAALARKESCDCLGCGAKLRARRMAAVLLDLYPGERGPRPHSLAEWAGRPEARALRVVEINRIDGLHEVLARLPRFEASDFLPDVPPGTTVDGVRSEDLTRLTYPDATFDLVLTSETLEHVPDLDAALGELMRVLAPGGRHVCTVPLVPSVPHTYARARLRADGSVEALATPICHPGGDTGYPVFTEIGADFPEILRAAGFEVDVRFGPATDDDLAQVYVCRKP